MKKEVQDLLDITVGIANSVKKSGTLSQLEASALAINQAVIIKQLDKIMEKLGIDYEL